MKHIKVYISLIVFITTIIHTKAQEYFSLNNLGDYVIQSQNLSPVYLPKNTFTFAVPIANGSFNYNSGFKANELLVFNSLTNKLEINLKNLFNEANNENNLNLDISVNLFYIGFKRKHGSLTVFANSRSTNNWKYSKEFLKIAANGINEDFALNEQNEYTGYNEIGIGFTQTFYDDQLAIGIKLKYLNGYVHSSTNGEANVSLTLDENTGVYDIYADNAVVNNSGSVFNNRSGEFRLFTGNTGFGFDFGATFHPTQKLTFEIAINDIGKINWNEDVTNLRIKDTGPNGSTLPGLNLTDYYNSTDNLQDDVLNLISSVTNAEETTDDFSSNLNMKTYLSAKYALSEKSLFTLAFFNTHAFDTFKPSYSLGYNVTLEKATFGVLAGIGGVENNFMIGTNFAVLLGPIQLYAATDSLEALFAKPEESTSANVSLGINFIFNKATK